MIVHPPVEAVSLITGQLLLDTMRDDTQRPTSATFFACLPFQRSIDSKKKKNDRATYLHRSTDNFRVTINDKGS